MAGTAASAGKPGEPEHVDQPARAVGDSVYAQEHLELVAGRRVHAGEEALADLERLPELVMVGRCGTTRRSSDVARRR
jgi:hypothetical protein